MKREPRHMPCQFKIDRVRARYTRVHKALARLKDAHASGALERALSMRSEMAFDMHRHMNVRLWRTVNEKGRHLYLLEIQERGRRLYGRKGDDVGRMLGDLRDAAMADEALEIGLIWI